MAPSSEYLPWDVRIEILSWLPVQSLMRFKSVSKSFHNLISNDHFFKNKHLHHHHHHQSSLKLLVTEIKSSHIVRGAEEKAYTFSFSSLSSPCSGDIVCEDTIQIKLPISIGHPTYMFCGLVCNACDGLLCIELGGGGVVIWNPSTREAKEFRGGAIQPLWTRYSLARDSRSNVYKLLEISKYYNNTHKMRFYSPETETWRCVDRDCPPPSDVHDSYFERPEVVNGAFHWLAVRERVVVSLNVSDETYGMLALPQALCGTTKKRLSYLKLCVLKGMLCVFCRREYSHEQQQCRFELWAMKEYGVVDSMVRVFSFSCVDQFFSCWPLLMLEDDTIIMFTRSVGALLSFYEEEKIRIRFLRNPWVGGRRRRPIDDQMVPYVYFESLVSPHTCLEKANVIISSDEIVAIPTTTSRGVATRIKSWPRHYFQRFFCCMSGGEAN